MLHPSYNDLIKAINQNQENEDQKVKSRYSVVIAASKRARQLIAGAEPYVRDDGRKPLSIAVDEIHEGLVTIVGDDDLAEEENDAAAETATEAFVQETETTSEESGEANA